MVNLCCAWNDSWRTQLKFGVGGGTGVQTWRNIFNPLRRLLNLSKQKWRPAHSSSIQSPWFASCPHPISANIIMVLVIFSNGHSAQKPNFTQQSNVSACTSVDWAVRNQEEEIQELENKNLESGANFFWSWARDLLWCTFEAAANGKSWIMWSVFESSNACI